MDENRLTEARGEIIRDFIELETMVNSAILLHYFKEISRPFYYEVLYDESFAFYFKLNILAKMVPRDKIHESHIGKLRRLGEIRNYFAHRGTQFLSTGKLGENGNGMVGVVPNPKKLDEAIDFDKLYEEFQAKQPDEVRYLYELTTKIAESKLK